MRIRVKRGKKGGTVIQFRAESDQEGIDLKDSIVAACKTGPVVEVVAEAVAEQLAHRGYSVAEADGIVRVGSSRVEIKAEADRKGAGGRG